VTVIHPNIKQTDALLIILEGEYAGRFALCICHSHSYAEDTALVSLIDQIEGSIPSQPGIEVHIAAKHLGITFETKEEKKRNKELVKERRKQTRSS
jgi:hypothetical protein